MLALKNRLPKGEPLTTIWLPKENKWLFGATGQLLILNPV